MRFLFVDRVLDCIPEVSIHGIKQITADDYYLCQDDHGHTCFIPSLVGETLGQLAAWNVMVASDFAQRPVAGVCASAKFERSAYVGETLLLEAFIDSLDYQMVAYHATARVGDQVVCTLEGSLGPLLPMQDFIDPQCARKQWAEINRPAAWPVLENTAGEALFVPTIVSRSMTFDRLCAIEPLVGCVAEKCLTRTADYWPDHFPNKPVLPLTVLLECKRNLARSFLERSGLSAFSILHEVRKIKMHAFILPGDNIMCTVRLKQRDDQQVVLSFRSDVAGKKVCVMEMVMLHKALV